MKHIEIHAHYLRQLVQDFVVKIFYCRIDGQIVDFFMNPIPKENFVKLRVILELQEATIMGGCTKVISIPRYLDHCVDGMVLEQ